MKMRKKRVLLDSQRGACRPALESPFLSLPLKYITIHQMHCVFNILLFTIVIIYNYSSLQIFITLLLSLVLLVIIVCYYYYFKTLLLHVQFAQHFIHPEINYLLIVNINRQAQHIVEHLTQTRR